MSFVDGDVRPRGFDDMTSQVPLSLAPMPLVGHQTAVYAGGELLCSEVDEEDELDTVNLCCKA